MAYFSHAGSQTWQSQSRIPETVARSDAASQYRQSDESWVEVSSQPSSSSLSSVGDEIVTTDLRVRNQRRRRTQQKQMPASYLVSQSSMNAGTSSQEEYEETESEEDRVMMGPAENAQQTARLDKHQEVGGADMVSEDDENATTLGRPSNSPIFRPQPNAFSHPPSHVVQRRSTNSSIPQHPPHHRPSAGGRSNIRPQWISHPITPSHQADHDAALRASLTTLLSCAAAARGLPKKDGYMGHAGSSVAAAPGIIPSSQPVELRLVPESELMGDDAGPSKWGRHPQRPPQALPRTASNSSAPSAPSAPSSTSSREREAAAVTERNKRAAAQQKITRAAKKKRSNSSGAVRGDITPFISPTLLTWVVSAGVVVLVSVVGFGAGYMLGREVGKQGGAINPQSASAASNVSSCGRELVRTSSGGTLGRFRWGSMGSSVMA